MQFDSPDLTLQIAHVATNESHLRVPCPDFAKSKSKCDAKNSHESHDGICRQREVFVEILQPIKKCVHLSVLLPTRFFLLLFILQVNVGSDGTREDDNRK